MIEQLQAAHWPDYELIDSGDFEKLERFGPYTMARPEPQALWKPSLDKKEWEKNASAWFDRDPYSPEKGVWSLRPEMPKNWVVAYNEHKGLDLKFKMSLSSFKHIGLFPEQCVHWPWIYDRCKAMDNPKVLNLFAYTGASSLAACAGGAAVTHLDSVKQTVTWARESMETAGLDGIRWIVDDALAFVKREVRRGNTYEGLIIDPPAYGRGPDGEKWVLEEQLHSLLEECNAILNQEKHFVVINLYSLGQSFYILENVVNQTFGKVENASFGEVYIADRFNKKLPLGIYGRFFR